MKREYIYILLSAIIFSTMEIAGKSVAAEIHPLQLNFWRFLIGAIILFPPALYSLHRKHIHWEINDILFFFFTGLLGIIISMSFFQLAIVYTKASTVAILFSVNPVFTIPFACYLLKEKWTATTLSSLAISIAGVMFLLTSSMGEADIQGILFSLCSAISFALFSVVCKMRAARYGGIVINCFSFLAGDLLLLIIILLSHIPLITQIIPSQVSFLFANIPLWAGIHYTNISTLLYLGTIVTGLGFLFYFLAIENTSSSISSIVFFLKPVLAPIFAFLILKETILPGTILGILAILAGACIMVNGRQQLKPHFHRKMRCSA